MSNVLNVLKAATLALALKSATPVFAQEVEDRKIDKKEIRNKSRDEVSNEDEETYVDDRYWDYYGVTKMTPEEKIERMAEIEKELSTIDSVIDNREKTKKIVSEIISKNFYTDKYSKMDWKIPTGGYIVDEIDKKFQKQLEDGVDGVTEAKIQNDSTLLSRFFKNEKCRWYLDKPGFSVEYVVNFYIKVLDNFVQEGSFTEEEAQIIKTYLAPYMGLKMQPTASKHDLLVKVANHHKFKDFSDLLSKAWKGEITSAQYEEKLEYYKTAYRLLLETIEKVSKTKRLDGTTSVWAGFSAVSGFTDDAVRYYTRKKAELQEERGAILNPPSPPSQVQNVSEHKRRR